MDVDRTLIGHVFRICATAILSALLIGGRPWKFPSHAEVLLQPEPSILALKPRQVR